MRRCGCGARSPTPAASCKACTRWDEPGSAQATATTPNAASPRPEQLADSLGETLERAKIWHTRAELLLRDGDAGRAQELATSALETFTQSRTRYDITHARVTLSRAARASGQERLAIQQGALARSSVQVMGYGLLCVLYPDEVFDLAARIDGALTAYACGDALGVPWESQPDATARATPSQIEQLPAREGWPRGATSDDTALTLLVARHLADRDGDGDPAAFLADLAGQEPAIRGLGPTTTAAIERFRRGDEPAASSTKSHERGGDARPAHRLGTTPRPSRTTPASDDRDVPGHPRRPRRAGRGVRDRSVRVMGTGGRQPVHAAGGRRRRSPRGRPGGHHRGRALPRC